VPPPDKPLVTALHDGRRQAVAAADRAARALGLFPGMPLAQAQARVPDLAVATAEPEAETRGLDGLAAWCLRMRRCPRPIGRTAPGSTPRGRASVRRQA